MPAHPSAMNLRKDGGPGSGRDQCFKGLLCVTRSDGWGHRADGPWLAGLILAKRLEFLRRAGFQLCNL